MNPAALKIKGSPSNVFKRGKSNQERELTRTEAPVVSEIRSRTDSRLSVECVDYILCTPNPNVAAGSERPFPYATLPCCTAQSPRRRVHAASHPCLLSATMPVPNRSNSTNVGSHQGSLGRISESAQLGTENFMMEPNISAFIYIFHVHLCFIHI